MNMPSWLLLLWCGLGGTCGAAVVGALLGGATRASWSLDPRPESIARGVAWSVLAGLLVYPVVYGVLFETLSRSDYRIGLLFGAGHAVIAIITYRRNLTNAASLRLAAMHIAYGTITAFLYVAA
jgi:hypothetical protein